MQRLAASIPSESLTSLRCCCGNPDCAHLAYGTRAIRELDSKLVRASREGLNLLARSEEFEEVIAQQGSHITQLELANTSLELRNSSIAKENDALSYEIESLNRFLSERDAAVESLAATLHATQREVERLTLLVSKTEQLEELLRQMDFERLRLQDTLTDTEDEKQKANASKRKSERDYQELEQQLEKLELEARREHQQHAETLAHLGMRTPTNVDMNGRSIAGSATVRKSGAGMSNFVNQILEENSTLRVDISELEAMLRHTRDEMEDLRGQMLSTTVYEDLDSGSRTPKSLSQELVLGLQPHQNSSPEVHVHHHYHDPIINRDPPSRSRTIIHQRPRKRRPAVLSSSRATSAYYHRPSSRAFSSSPSSESPLDSKRWSSFSGGTQSAYSASSTIPSSPPTSVSSYFDNAFKHAAPLSPLEDLDLPPTPDCFYESHSALSEDTDDATPLPRTTIPSGTFRPPLRTALSSRQESLPVLSAATAEASAAPKVVADSTSLYLRNQQSAMRRQSAPQKESYAPLTDTFGWFKSRLSGGAPGKGQQAQRRITTIAGVNAGVSAVPALVDADALAECLGEEVEG